MTDVTNLEDEAGSSSLIAYEGQQAVAMARAEIDTQIATSHAFPRSMARVQKAMLEIVQLDNEAAMECVYAVPIEGKSITGPSIRFAEALKQSFGNCTAGARVTETNRTEMYVEAEGVFWDLETNTRTVMRSRRSIRGKKGRCYSDRMIVTTQNAACSIAMREAILKGVPRPLWRASFEAVLLTIRGDVKTLVERRERAVTAFALFGVSAERIFERLDVKGMDDIGLDDLPELFAMFQSIKSGEGKVEDYFPTKGAVEHEIVHDPLRSAPVEQIEKKERVDAGADLAKREADRLAAEQAALAERNARYSHQDPSGSAKEDRNADHAGERQAEQKKPPAPATGSANDAFPGDLPPKAAAKPAGPNFADLDAWRARGAENQKRGMGRKAYPPELRTEGRDAEAALLAYLEGFDAARAG